MGQLDEVGALLRKLQTRLVGYSPVTAMRADVPDRLAGAVMSAIWAEPAGRPSAANIEEWLCAAVTSK
ncbi:MAG: hypothetical protein LAO05_18480 [Acidobacteriia bacterium]|nr:hypothetical protein [Terriglobia bacterium]